MGIDTASSNWGAMSVANASGNIGLGARGTVYVLRNMDNGDRFLFLLADLGIGFTFGVRLNQIFRNLGKTLLSDKSFNNPASFTKIAVNRSFSADDLDLSPGAEATIGIVALTAGVSATSISGWPFFQGAPKPGETVDNDYFSGSVIYSTTDIGLSAGGAYQFIGRWFELWTF
jgi:hypothetical protein